MYGFYPKFENDKDREENFDISIFNDVKEINFNFKYSGFLGQVIAFDIDGTKYWTTCSKNDTSNKYSDNLYNLIKNSITEELLTEMCNNNIHFCGETMSKYDQVHGAEVLNEAFIITLVSKGKWLKYNNSTIILKNNKIVNNDKFIEPYNQEEMHNFCMNYNLNIDNIYKISLYDSITNFIIGLNNIRNFISLNNFNNYWNFFSKNEKYINYCKIEEGNTFHENILGNILEGLIIKIINNDESIKIIKYKFPYYTSRTFLLRTYLKNCNDQKQNKLLINKELKTNNTKIKNIKEIHQNQNECFDKSKFEQWKKYYENYNNYWLVNDDMNGKEYWSDIFKYLFDNYSTLNENYNKYIDNLLEESKDNINKLIGKHIFLMDELFKIKYKNTNTIKYTNAIKYNKVYNSKLYPNLENIGNTGNKLKFDFGLNLSKFKINSKIQLNINSNKIINIILILGPIAAGKSTTCNLIENINKELFKHIDGDLLDLDCIDTVLQLSEERNNYTKYKVIEQIINNKIPILSTGGGVLFNNKKEFDFISNLDNIFNKINSNINIKLTIFIPNNDNNFEFINNTIDIIKFKEECSKFMISYSSLGDYNYYNKIKFIHDMYFDRKQFNICTKYRNYNKILSNKIFKRSTQNFDIMLQIFILLNKNNISNIGFYPINKILNNKNSNLINKSSIIQIQLEKFIKSFNLNLKLNLKTITIFREKRFLVSFMYNNNHKFHHITLDYSDIRKIKLPINNNSINELQNTKQKGYLYTCYDTEDIKKINNILIKAEDLYKNDNKDNELLELIEYLKALLNDYTKIYIIPTQKESPEKRNKTIKSNEEINYNKFRKIIGTKITKHNQSLVLPIKYNTISLIIFPRDITSKFNQKLQNKLHITVDNRNHKPSLIGDVATIIYNSINNVPINNIELIDNHGKVISYNFNKSIDIDVNFYTIFYI